MKLRYSVPSKVLAVMWLAGQISGCGAFSDDSKALDRAEAAIGRGDFSEAMVLLHGPIEHAPDDSRTQLLAARAATMLGDYAGADRALGMAEKHGAVGTARMRAELLVRSGQGEKALAWIDAEPQRQEAWAPALRLRALMALKRCEEAMPLAARLATQEATKGAAALAIAECHARSGRLTRALRDLTDANSTLPDDPEVWLALGQLQRLVGNSPQAETAWKEAAKRAGGTLSATQKLLMYAGIGDVQSERGDVDGLRETHRQLAKLAAEAPIVDILAARIDLIDGKTGDATTTLRRVMTKSEESAAAHVLLVAAYLDQANFEQARRETAWLEQHSTKTVGANQGLPPDLVDRVEKTAQGSPDRARALVQAQVRLGLPDVARATLVREHESHPDDDATSLLLAQVDLLMHRIPEAQSLVESLVAKSPNDSAALRTQAEIYMAAARFADADVALAKLAPKSPDASVATARHRVRVLGKLPEPGLPLEQWLTAHPRDFTVRALYASWLSTIKENRRSIAEYETLVAAGAESPIVLNNLAWLYVLEGDRRAVATAQRAVQRAPNVPTIADTYGWALVRAGSARDGLEVLRAADAQAKGTMPSLRFHLAAALAETGDAAAARTLLSTLLNDSDEFAERDDASRLLAQLSEAKANVTQ